MVINSNNNSLVISASNLKLSATTLTIATGSVSPSSYYPVVMSSTGRIYRSTSTINNLSVYNSQRLGGTTASYYMKTNSNYYYVHNITATINGSNSAAICNCAFRIITNSSSKITSTDQLLLALSDSLYNSADDSSDLYIPISGCFNIYNTNVVSSIEYYAIPYALSIKNSTTINIKYQLISCYISSNNVRFTATESDGKDFTITYASSRITDIVTKLLV